MMTGNVHLLSYQQGADRTSASRILQLGDIRDMALRSHGKDQSLAMCMLH